MIAGKHRRSQETGRAGATQGPLVERLRAAGVSQRDYSASCAQAYAAAAILTRQRHAAGR